MVNTQSIILLKIHQIEVAWMNAFESSFKPLKPSNGSSPPNLLDCISIV